MSFNFNLILIRYDTSNISKVSFVNPKGVIGNA
jgi:hypothetical protein